MDEPRYVDLLDRLSGSATEPHLREDAVRVPANELVGVLRRPWKQLRRSVGSLDPNPSDAGLHEIRIRAKRLRYGAESLAPVAGKPVARVAKRAADLQYVLGEQHDAIVAIGWLREAADGADAKQAFLAGRLTEAERESDANARSTWLGVWKSLLRAAAKAGLE